MAKFKEILTPRQRAEMRKRRARGVMAKEGILIIPKKTKSAKFRSFLRSAQEEGHKIYEVEQDAEKEFKKKKYKNFI